MGSKLFSVFCGRWHEFVCRVFLSRVFFLAVYQIEPSAGMRKVVVTNTAQRDMVKQYPPCRHITEMKKPAEGLPIILSTICRVLAGETIPLRFMCWLRCRAVVRMAALCARFSGMSWVYLMEESWRDSQHKRQNSDGVTTQPGIFISLIRQRMDQPRLLGERYRST